MTGTIVNTLAIILGCLIGSVTKRGIKDEYKTALFNSIGLCASCLGVSVFVNNLPNAKYPVMFILAMALGTLFGTICDLSGKFDKLTSKIGGEDFSKGLSTAILLFCIGTLSILGPVQSALYHDYTFLYTNAALDFVTSVILACAYGFGIVWSALVLFLWQGAIYISSLFLGEFISQSFFCEISIVGGLLILSSGLSILKIKNLKTMDMLPSIIMVPLFWVLIHIYKMIAF
ncbi:DUF554 domain-containing protein [bacterium]|nr:DUF554 domain-containing protein [bacterium]